MNLWSFTFTNPDFGWVRARVAAPTKEAACLEVGKRIELPLTRHPTIIAFMGRQDFPEPGIVEITFRRPA